MVFISGTKEQCVLTEGRCSGFTIQLLKRSAVLVLKTCGLSDLALLLPKPFFHENPKQN